MRNRTYYRGTDAVVTDQLFVWRTTSVKGFIVRELHDVGLVHPGTDRLRRTTAPVTLLAMVLAGTAWATLTLLTATVTTVVLALLLLVFTTMGRRLRPRRWEMRATYQGRPVVLYASTDPRTFNQVARALRRSVEDCRRPTVAAAA